MSIDWSFISTVPWPFVAVLSVATFVAALLGNLISARSRFFGALLTAILFAALYVVLYHYPHGFDLPLRPKGP